MTTQVVPYSTATNIGGLGGIYYGSGDPNATFKAPKGSLYIRSDGNSVSTRLYINEDGVTAWASITTSA